VCVVGTDELAMAAVVALQKLDLDVVLLQRRATLRPVFSPNVVFLVGQITGIHHIHNTNQSLPCVFGVDVDHVFPSLDWMDSEGNAHVLSVDGLFVFNGLSPKLGPVAQWGISLQHKQVEVDVATFQTNIDNVFAVGDVNCYASKKKLLVCGFHEATMAAFAVAKNLNLPHTGFLQYTSSSALLQQRLGLLSQQKNFPQKDSD
jgi:thioredoxin reductase (NADPH)